MAGRVCPWWMGYVLASPVRKLVQNPGRIFGSCVTEGMVVVDVGAGMGFFTLPLARLVGESGKVVAVDLQEKMIRALGRRADKAGLGSRIEGRVCGPDSLGLGDMAGKADLVCALYVVHEVPDTAGLMAQFADVLAPGGRLVLGEPQGHVSEAAFEQTLGAAEKAGFARLDRAPAMARSRMALLERLE